MPPVAGVIKAGQMADQILDLLAKSAPQAAEKLNRIKSALKGVIAEIAVNQAPSAEPAGGHGMPMPSAEGNGKPY